MVSGTNLKKKDVFSTMSTGEYQDRLKKNTLQIGYRCFSIACINFVLCKGHRSIHFISFHKTGSHTMPDDSLIMKMKT